METTSLNLDGIEFIVPAFLPEYWPHHLPRDEFPSFCGAGGGFGDAIVPERNWGLKESRPCFVHDISWAVAAATWADFHQANSMFLHNLLAEINGGSGFPLKQLRNYRAVTYFNAVDTVGARYFWPEKEELGCILNPLDHPVVREKLELVGTWPLAKAA